MEAYCDGLKIVGRIVENLFAKFLFAENSILGVSMA
jgi:hypothetical protein